MRVIILASSHGTGGTVTVTNLDNDVLGTCQAPPMPMRRVAACTISVPVNLSVLVTARPTEGQAWRSFRGSECQSAPGPVCHIAIADASQSVSVIFGASRPGPVVTTESPLTYGHSPEMSAGDNTVIAHGSGFPAGRAAVLTDDGTTVATGTTDAHGAVTLTYDSSSEPGVYRTLAVQAGGRTARTDIYNTLVYGWGEGDEGTGAIFFVITETDMDAHPIDNFVQFDSNGPVPVTFTDGSASQGYAQIQTPHYTCAAGTPGTLRIYGTRGAGEQRYTYSFSISITC